MIHPFPNTTWHSWGGLYPELQGDGHFVAAGTHVIGNVKLEADTSLWFNAVVRADNTLIRIGRGTNIQDGAIVHSDPGYPTLIGEYVTVGHRAILHGCTIGDGSLIGMGAIVMNGAKIGSGCLIAAGALVLEGFEAPDNTLIMGSPARIRRTLTEEESTGLRASAENYIARAHQYRANLKAL